MRRLRPLWLALLALAPIAALAERPNAMRLFPSRCVFFVRSPDLTELDRKFDESSFFQDPEIRPFLNTLMAKVDAAFREGDLGAATGGGLFEFLELFQGEVAFGVVPRPNEGPGLILLADAVAPGAREAGDELAIADGRDRITKLVEAAKERSATWGRMAATEQIGSVEAVVMRKDDNVNDAAGIVDRDGVLLICNDRVLLESIIGKWDEAEGLDAPEPALLVEGEDERRIDRLRRRYAEALADSPAFTESIRQCVEERIGGGDDAPPGLTAFVDPVGIFRAVAQRNTGMRVALATLPILGIDGVQGGAIAMWVDHGDWDSLFRGHLLIDNPRAGVLKMARLAPVDATPSDAIPADAAEYVCGGADLAALLDGAGTLYDRIRGEGEFQKLVNDVVVEKVGVEPAELFERMTGRIESVQAYGATPEGRAMRVNPSRAVTLETTDPEWVRQALEKVLKATGAKAQWDEHGGIEYVVFIDMSPVLGDSDSERRRRRQRRRLEATGAMTCAAFLDDKLVLSQTPELLHKLIETHAGDHPRLAEHLPFRLTASRARRLGQESMAGGEGRLLTYQDPGAQFRQWAAAGRSEESLSELRRLSEFAPPMRWLRDTIDEVGVPSDEALMKHATPSGGALFDTPTGFRYVAFSFKLDDE